MLSLSAEVEAEPAPVGLGLALSGQGAEVVARVFVAGHGEGGTAAPRVAERAPVAGLVILAGGAQPPASG